MKKRVIIKSIVAERFERVMKQGRVLFFSAPCGFGKTCLAEKLTEGLSSLYVSADQPGFSVPDRSGAWQVLVLDDLQTLQEAQQAAAALLQRENLAQLPEYQPLLARIHSLFAQHADTLN